MERKLNKVRKCLLQNDWKTGITNTENKAWSKLEIPIFKRCKALPLVPVNFPLITSGIKGPNKDFTFYYVYYLYFHTDKLFLAHSPMISNSLNLWMLMGNERSTLQGCYKNLFLSQYHWHMLPLVRVTSVTLRRGAFLRKKNQLFLFTEQHSLHKQTSSLKI